MVSPFAAYEDERRRRLKRALGIPDDAPPEQVDALVAELEARIATSPAVPRPAPTGSNPFAAFMPRNVSPQPAPEQDGDFSTIVSSRFPERAAAIQRERTRRGIPTGPTPQISPAAEQLRQERISRARPQDYQPFGALSPDLPPDERLKMLGAIAMLAPAPLSPARTAGSIIVAEAAPRIVKAMGGGPTAQTVAGIGGGILGGGPELVPLAGRLALRGGAATVRGGAKLAEGMGRANVGNVMLPRAPARVAQPLIYEDLAPIERRLYGIKGPSVRLSQDELTGARDYLYGPADAATGLRPGGVVSPEDTARIQAFEERYRGMSQLAQRRQEVAKVLAKYEPNALEKFRPSDVAGGPIAQAGFGGEMGPGQVARGAAEQPRMTQAPLSEIAASEADRIAKTRARPVAPPPPSEPGFTDLGPGATAAHSGEQRFAQLKAAPPRSVLTSRPRYRDVEPRFESDFDKAVFIVTNPGASKRHPEMLAWVQSAAPEGFDVAGAGSVIRARLKSMYRPGQPLRITGQVTGKTLESAADPTAAMRPLTKPLGGPTDVPRQQQPPNLLAGTRDPIQPTTGVQPASAGPVPTQGQFTPPPPSVPPTGRVGGPGGLPPPPQGILAGMQRPSITGNIIGLRDITPGLTKGEELQNVLLGAGRKARLPFHLNNQYGTAAVREKQRVATSITSQATQRAHREAVAIRQAFKLEEDLFVPSLDGKVARVKGAPSIQDIQDYYPQYEPFLTPAQKTALAPIVKTHEEYTDLLNKVGVGFKPRASTVIGGGKYIARVAKGLLNQEDARGVPARGLFASPKKGFEREILFETAAEGRAAGIKYAGIENTLRFHYQQAGQRATEQHLANYLTEVVDDANWPVSLPHAGEMGRRAVDLPVLAEESFPEAVANSINKVLVSEGSTVGAGRNLLEAVRIVNRGYRGLRASLDNSFMGIQMLLSAYAHPVAASKAAKLNLLSWKDKNVLTRYMDAFDGKAAQTGRLNSNQWVAEGNLHLGATTGEFGIEGLQKLPGFKQAGRAFGYTGDGLRLDVVDSLLEQEVHGYRVFGVGPEIGKGRTLAEIRASGDLLKIGEIANNMTGVAKTRFGGDLGEILLFAPRFFQSRMETLGKGLMGLRPGAEIDQKIARRSLFKMVAIGTSLTVAVNELNGQETDFRPVLNGRKNPNFMRIRALGRDWSVFGTWDSFLGLMIAAGHADAEGVLRSQGSAITSSVWDIASGADFLGRSTRSLENRAIYVLRQLSPFSGEQTAGAIGQTLSGEPQDIAAGAVAAVSTLAGAKSSPLSFTDHANEIAAAKYNTTWEKLKADRDAAGEAAIAKGKSPESAPLYKTKDAIMDKIADAVDKQYPQDAIPKRLTVTAKREELAQRLYNKNYGDLYANQKAKINRTIAGIITASKSSSGNYLGGNSASKPASGNYLGR